MVAITALSVYAAAQVLAASKLNQNKFVENTTKPVIEQVDNKHAQQETFYQFLQNNFGNRVTICDSRAGCIHTVPYTSVDGAPHRNNQDPIIASVFWTKLLFGRLVVSPNSEAVLKMGVLPRKKCYPGFNLVDRTLTGPYGERADGSYCSKQLHINNYY